MSGNINVGLFCSYANEVFYASFSLAASAHQWRDRFCAAKPPDPKVASPVSEMPGGPCAVRTLSLPANAVANAAGYATNILVPGEIVTIFAPGLGPATDSIGPVINPQGTVDTVLGGTRVLFSGSTATIPGPMGYATRDQLSAVAPWDIQGFPEADKFCVYLEVERNGQLSNIVCTTYGQAGLQLFTLNQSGKGQVAAINQDGTINGPDSPAPRGSIVSVFGTGGGQTRPAQTNGQVVPADAPFPQLPGPVRVTVNGNEAEVTYSGAAPLAIAGLVQINFRVPSNVFPAPAIPMAAFFGANANEVFIAVK
jgi:uncharacterized protein (TIGR03437 family)